MSSLQRLRSVLKWNPKYISSIQLCNKKSYSINTPPEELQENVPALSDNIDMKNLTLQALGGRSSVSGIRATVFGASSVLGKAVVNQLGQIGSQIVLPYRGDGTEMHSLKLMGDLGQIVPLPYQVRDKRSVERVIQDSNVVINLISKRRESRNFSFHDTHVNVSHMLARTSAELGVDRFIQCSVSNANPDSGSLHHKTKYLGEQVVKAFYPEATIVRPGTMFGFGDWFFERFAQQWGQIYRRPTIYHGNQKIQPCHYLDVARTIVTSILDPDTTSGKTIEIYGNVCAKKKHFYERIQEVMACEKFDTICYRDYNGNILGPIVKPLYPLYKQFQFCFDFFRSWPWCQFMSYEDIQQEMIDMYEDEERLYNENILTQKDLGLIPEDYFYWETKVLEMYWDRLRRTGDLLEQRGRENTWGGPPPTTAYLSFHSVAYHGHRGLRKGAFDDDAYAPDQSGYDWSQYEKPNPVKYGADIDGNSYLHGQVEK